MFKRANKITSLLVTAAAVMSLVPAYAADVKKVDSQDGKVYNAVAYKDGKSYVDGELNNKDEATYYVADGKYNNLSDVDAGADITAYGTKYVEVQGGDYFLDLTTGKVTDDKVAENARDDAGSALRKKVKADTDGRFIKDEAANVNAAARLVTFVAGDEITGSAFGDVWYKTTFTAKDATNIGNFANTNEINVFTDANGNYIDADYNLGKVKVTTTSSAVGSTSGSKSVYVDNTKDTFDTQTPKVNVSAAVSQGTVIGQDKDYIYRTAIVTVSTTGAAADVAKTKITQIDGKDVTCTAYNQTATGTATDSKVSFSVIQKISKAQSSDEVGGVKYAKTVNTYVLSDDKAGTKSFFPASNGELHYSIADGKVINYALDITNKQIDIQTITLKSEDGLYYTDFSSATTDKSVENLDSKLAVTVDAAGNVWRLDGGYLYQWNNDEDWDKVYKVDGSLNQVSVYDKNNIIAWNESDEVYSVIGGKTTAATTTAAATTETTTATAGWVQAADKTWTYNTATGTKATGWLQLGSTWYYLNDTGVMATGWKQVGSTWYYLAQSGAMATGWLQDTTGTWYYTNASGAMLSNTVVDGYKLGASGAWVK
jgi:hypothetical protein